MKPQSFLTGKGKLPSSKHPSKAAADDAVSPAAFAVIHKFATKQTVLNEKTSRKTFQEVFLIAETIKITYFVPMPYMP